MIATHSIDTLPPEQLRQALDSALAEVQRHERQAVHNRALIDKLTHEMAVLKRLKFAAKSESFNAEQKSLLEDALDADLAALAQEIEQREPTKVSPGEKRQAKPSDARCRPRCRAAKCATSPIASAAAAVASSSGSVKTWQRSSTTCPASSRLNAMCAASGSAAIAKPWCKRPWPPHIIDKGIPTTGLLTQVLVAKYLDHLPLYRQEGIFGRAGLAIPRSTLAEWVGQCGVQLQPLVDALRTEMLSRNVLHADETPVAMLKPGHGKTHRAYLWSYCTTAYDGLRAVIFDFADSRGGQHVRAFLGLGEGSAAAWQGKLVCDDFSGYKACFELGVTEAGCLAHARRKFHELWANHGSPVGEQALKFFAELYDIQREARELDPDERKRLRQLRS